MPSPSKPKSGVEVDEPESWMAKSGLLDWFTIPTIVSSMLSNGICEPAFGVTPAAWLLVSWSTVSPLLLTAISSPQLLS
jgi:hypothetical protein